MEQKDEKVLKSARFEELKKSQQTLKVFSENMSYFNNTLDNIIKNFNTAYTQFTTGKKLDLPENLTKQWNELVEMMEDDNNNKNFVLFLEKAKAMHAAIVLYLTDKNQKSPGTDDILFIFAELAKIKKFKLSDEIAKLYYSLLLAISDWGRNIEIPQYERFITLNSAVSCVMACGLDLDEEKKINLQDEAAEPGQKENVILFDYLNSVMLNSLFHETKKGHDPLETMRFSNYRKIKNIPLEHIVNYMIAHPEQAIFFLKRRHGTKFVGRNFRKELCGNAALLQKIMALPVLANAIRDSKLLESSHVNQAADNSKLIDDLDKIKNTYLSDYFKEILKLDKIIYLTEKDVIGFVNKINNALESTTSIKLNQSKLQEIQAKLFEGAPYSSLMKLNKLPDDLVHGYGVPYNQNLRPKN